MRKGQNNSKNKMPNLYTILFFVKIADEGFLSYGFFATIAF